MHFKQVLQSIFGGGRGGGNVYISANMGLKTTSVALHSLDHGTATHNPSYVSSDIALSISLFQWLQVANRFLKDCNLLEDNLWYKMEEA